MARPSADAPAPPPGEPPGSEPTGLPGVRRWRTVYIIVLAVFVFWVVLLTWLTRHFA